MYPYEDYDLIQLQSDPSLDPGSPEVLYAMAQCFHLGRGGADRDESAAQELLQAAAEAGSELAREALEGQKSDPAPEVSSQDYAGMALHELKKLEQAGDLRAGLERYRRCMAVGDQRNAERCVAGCAQLAVEGRMDLQLRREALEIAGAFYQDRDRAESRRLYELARELGSVAACGKLLDYYTCGLGGPAEPELAEDCVLQMERQGGPELLYQAAVWRTNENGGVPSLDARDSLERLKEQTAGKNTPSEGGHAQ